MRVVLSFTYRASRKEPLGDVVERIHGAFIASGLGEPAIAFALSDSPLTGAMSSVARVLRRHPELRPLMWTGPELPNFPKVKQVSNGPGSPAPGQSVPFATLLAIAKGVPRSFPLHKISFHFQSPAFGDPMPAMGPLKEMPTGVIVGDGWWVNGRTRAISALVTLDVAPDSATIPSPPKDVALVLAACGKVESTTQTPLANASEGSPARPLAAASPDVLKAVSQIVRSYRSRLADVIDRARLPHDLPPALEALKVVSFGEITGPKKPALVQAFKPLGYDCRGLSGGFILRRRTAGNITVELELDVGTYSHSLTAMYRVMGLGFSTVLMLPVSKRAIDGGQYNIRDAAHWQQLVDNLAALVAELDRTLVPEIEAAAGPSPKWFTPESR